MGVTQICIGRFHHFHLARQFEKHGMLDAIYTGFPKFKLKDEQGIPRHKIKTFPWLQTGFMARGKVGLDKWNWLTKEWAWLSHQSLDTYVANRINSKGVLFSLSGAGLKSGVKMKSIGGTYICDRGSSHIVFQNELLKAEYERYGLTFSGVDPRIIKTELAEYAAADFITVPSEFVKQSFVSKGIDEKKIIKIAYGARLDRFQKVGEPSNDYFRVLWVGNVSIRKGFLDALKAFSELDIKKKEFVVIGTVSKEIKSLLLQYNLDKVFFKGHILNSELPSWYSSSHVFILSSVEEGLAMVQVEALACGCPVIATVNTGAQDLFTDGVEGFIVPIHSPNILKDRLLTIANNQNLRTEMSNAAIKRVTSIGGWDTYGNQMANFINTFN